MLEFIKHCIKQYNYNIPKLKTLRIKKSWILKGNRDQGTTTTTIS